MFYLGVRIVTLNGITFSSQLSTLENRNCYANTCYSVKIFVYFPHKVCFGDFSKKINLHDL